MTCRCSSDHSLLENGAGCLINVASPVRRLCSSWSARAAIAGERSSVIVPAQVGLNSSGVRDAVRRLGLQSGRPQMLNGYRDTLPLALIVGSASVVHATRVFLTASAHAQMKTGSAMAVSTSPILVSE